MNEKDLRQQLREKVDANYNAFLREWLGLEPTELIERAEEIAAARLVRRELKNGGYNADYLEYLLRFRNPLEVVRDQWLQGRGIALEEDMEHILWKLADTKDAEQDCELDEAFLAPEQDEEVQMC